jgi:hypothetical protein
LLIALAWPGAAERGIVAEEVQPYLRRHPLVLERLTNGTVQPMPPYEPGAPLRPRWVATSQWPVVAYDGQGRMWPLFIRGHESALGSYVGLALGPFLGGGIAGVRRSTVLLSALLVALTWALARRTGGRAPWLASLLFAGSLGATWIARTGYGFVVASHVAMLAALLWAASARSIGARRAAAIGAMVGVAVLCRATVALALAPALALLLVREGRAMRSSAVSALLCTAIGLPLVFYAAVWTWAPFRADSAPLAGFEVESWLGRLASLPQQLILQTSWLFDATSILQPLYRGDRTLSWTTALLAPALVGCVPLGLAIVRWRRGSAGEGERMFAAAAASSIVMGALLYGAPNQFQLALALEPLFCIAVAEQLARVPAPRIRVLLYGAALLVRVQALAVGLRLDRVDRNPMLSGTAQRAAVARLKELGVRGPELVTTSYNHAGVLEAWDSALAPAHAWPLFAGDPQRIDDAWRALLTARRPGWVLVSEGTNLYEGADAEPASIRAALFRAASKLGLDAVVDGSFVTEAGSPGWQLLHLVEGGGRSGR